MSIGSIGRRGGKSRVPERVAPRVPKKIVIRGDPTRAPEAFRAAVDIARDALMACRTIDVQIVAGKTTATVKVT